MASRHSLSYRFYDTYNETGRPPFSGGAALSNVIAVPRGVDIS
jgi:hypothetical protein